MDAFMSMLLLLISYEQKTQTVEMFDVVKTVLAVAISTILSISSADVRFRLTVLTSTFNTKDP